MEMQPSASSHAVSMSSLLSTDPSTPRVVSQPSETSSLPSRSGLSSLMNSPLLTEDGEAQEEEEEEEEEEEAPGEEDVDMDETATLPKLQNTELQTLQTQLHAALLKLWTETPKRHKKSKQRRGKTNCNAAEMELHGLLHQLQLLISTQLAKKDVLMDVVTLCLGFCGALNGKDSVQSLLVLDEDKCVEMGETVANLPTKPVYGQVLAVLRRAVVSGEPAKELLRLVLDWCLARSTPEDWTWMLAVMSQMNSFCVQEFLFHEAIYRFRGDADEVKHFLPVLEFLATKYPAQMVDILRDVVENDEVSIQGLSTVDTVTQLVALASDSAALVSACDDSLQWVVTQELVTTLADKLGGEVNGNGNTSRSEGLERLLLQFLRERSAQLSNSGFQLLLLLQNLSDLELEPRIAASVASFKLKVLELAGSESSCAFAQGIYRFLPYICQSTLRLLQTMAPAEEDSDESMEESDIGENLSKETARQRFNEWKQWLCLLAQSISRKEVTEQLIKAELMLAEFNELPLAVPLTTVMPADRALCELLTSLLTPSSPEYVAFVRNIVHECYSAAPRARRRILGIVQTLLNLNDNDDYTTSTELPVSLSVQQGESGMLSLAQAKSWKDSLDSFELWKGVRGLEFWESFLDLARSKDSVVASRALSLLSRTPYLSLEDPSWQYRCVRKLSGVYFSLLRQYRADLVLQGDKSSELTLLDDSSLHSRLQTLKMILFRVLALDGGVAHYPSSVYSMFASLWLDALLSTTSATSIPTHFSNGVNFETDEDGGLLDERQVIRCERTISSKCTNLQSSQVITKVPEAKLVYRKTLDSSWEREMHAARVCSVYVTDIFSQLLASTGTASSLLSDSQAKSKTTPNVEEDEQLERRLKVMVGMLLERVVPCCGIPSDDIYKDMLPNRSSFDVDLRVEQWLNHFPAFLPLLRVVISTSTALGSSQLLRLVPVFKSALIVLLGHWNSVKGELSVENVDVPPYMRNQNQLALTCELMRLLRATKWLPVPLGKTAELLPMTTPADIRSILFSCWFYLSDHPPRSGSRAPTPATSATTSPISSGSSPAGFSISGLSTGGPTSSSSHPPIEFYLIPLRKALHRNMHKIGAKYPLFMCPSRMTVPMKWYMATKRPLVRNCVHTGIPKRINMELLLVRIDHFQDRATYVSVLRDWLQELQIVNGRVVSMGGLQLLFVAASAVQNDRLLEFYRSRAIDTNSRGELCVDKFIDVLGRKSVQSSGCKGFLEMNVLNKTLLQKVLVQEWKAEQSWLDVALATARTKTFLDWKEAAKAARKGRRKREGQEKQHEREAKKIKREQEAAQKALEDAEKEEGDEKAEDAVTDEEITEQATKATSPQKEKKEKMQEKEKPKQQQQGLGPKKNRNKKRRNKPAPTGNRVET